MEDGVSTAEHLDALLEDDLGPALIRTDRGTWLTTSGLPHEIRLHTEAGVDLVRVSAGALVDVEPTMGLFESVNAINVERAWTRRFVVDEKVVVAGEMPVRSVQPGDLEHLLSTVLCTARLDAPLLALHGGRPVTVSPPKMSPDLDSVVESWGDVLRASRTATDRELAVWIEHASGEECWIDRDDESVTVVVNAVGMTSPYPFRLGELIDDAQELAQSYGEDDD